MNVSLGDGGIGSSGVGLDEVTTFTIAAFVLHVVVMGFYCYSAFGASATRGPTQFWRSQRIRAKPLATANGSAGRPRFINAPPLNKRWAFVVLRSSQIHAIQTIRGTITGSIFFGQTAVMIVFLCLFFKSYTPRQHFIFMVIGVLAMASTVFFVQNLRMAYHLNYLVMVLPRKEKKVASPKGGNLSNNNNNAAAAAAAAAVVTSNRPPVVAVVSIDERESGKQAAQGDHQHSPSRRSRTPPLDGTSRRRASSAIQANIVDNSALTPARTTLRYFLEEKAGVKSLARGLPKVPSHLFQSFTHTTSVGEVALKQMAMMKGGDGGAAAFASPEEGSVATLIQAEEELDFQQHEERLADVLKLMSGNFALGVRTMIFALPLVFGLFHDGALLATSVLIMAVLAYFDRLM